MKLIFLVEEKSMMTLLSGILPRIVPNDISFQIIPHEGKSDLEKSIPVKLRAWNEPNVKFVIVQDQDANDCKELKKKLVDLAKPYGRTFLVRIACHELESWYFGDIKAIEQAYNLDWSKIRHKARYRVPDKIVFPKKALKELIPSHSQILGARKIAPYMDISNNTSHSFNVFVSGVQRMCE